MQAVEALETLELLGSTQWGLVTTAQATAAGVERLWLSRLTQRGTLQRVRHGVYSLPSAKIDPWQDLHAAWLATSPKETATERVDAADPIVVRGASAVALHRLGDLVPATHEFLSPNRHQSSQSDVKFIRENISSRDMSSIDGLPVTSVPRTIVDLARDSIDENHLADIATQALGAGEVDYENLAGRLDPHAEQYGHGDGHEFLEHLVELSPRPQPTETNRHQSYFQGVMAPYMNQFNKLTEPAMQPIRQQNLVGQQISDQIQKLVREAMSPMINQWGQITPKFP